MIHKTYFICYSPAKNNDLFKLDKYFASTLFIKPFYFLSRKRFDINNISITKKSLYKGNGGLSIFSGQGCVKHIGVGENVNTI